MPGRKGGVNPPNFPSTTKIPGPRKNHPPPPPNLPSTSTSHELGNNPFATLNPDEDIENMSDMISNTSKRRRTSPSPPPPPPQKSNQQKPKKTPKPPPFNVADANIKDMRNLLNSANIPKGDYKLKASPAGVQVHAMNDNIYKQVNENLKAANSKYFTYQTRQQQTSKFVLQGLYRMTVDELLELLTAEGIKPSSIKILSIRKPKYNDHCVYLLHFPKSENMKIATLREVESIDNVIVRWEHYKNKRNGPIQCSNCMQYGHGSQNCFLDPTCIRCGENHSSKACKILKDPESNKIPPEQVKCGLCGQNHTANYSKCQKRIEFINRQKIYRDRTQRNNRSQQRNHQFVNAPQLENFTYFQNKAQQGWSNQAQPQTQPKAQQSENNDNGELFSPEELTQIMMELMTLMKQAKSKLDQISALSQIVIKYCNHG